MYVAKTKGVTPNKENEDLKMINIHPNFVDVIKEPIYKNKKIDSVPRSVIMRIHHGGLPKISGCVIEELETKHDNT